MENEYWLYFSCSVFVFVICNMFLFFCVEGRIRGEIRSEREAAKGTTRFISQNQREEFKKEIEGMRLNVTIYVAISSSLTVAAAIASFSAERKRTESIVVSSSSALPTLCFFAFLNILDLAKPNARSSVEDQQNNIEALFFKAILLHRVGYRLLFFTGALCIGWFQPIPMFVATVVLMLYYIITDVRASTDKTSHQQSGGELSESRKIRINSSPSIKYKGDWMNRPVSDGAIAWLARLLGLNHVEASPKCAFHPLLREDPIRSTTLQIQVVTYKMEKSHSSPPKRSGSYPI